MQDSVQDEQAGGLVQACCRSILQLSAAPDLVAALTHFHSLAACLPHFHRRLVRQLARRLPGAALEDPGCCRPLSADMMVALLQCPVLVRPQHAGRSCMSLCLGPDEQVKVHRAWHLRCSSQLDVSGK